MTVFIYKVMYSTFNIPITPSLIQTPKYIELPDSISLTQYTTNQEISTILRCFNPYSNETMEDIKNDLIGLSTITENELDGPNGIIQRIRSISFYDAGKQEYGIIEDRNEKSIETYFYSSSYIYYDIGDIRYIIDGHKIYKTKVTIGPLNVDILSNSKDTILLDKLCIEPSSINEIKEVNIVIMHNKRYDHNNKYISFHHNLDEYTSVLIYPVNTGKNDKCVDKTYYKSNYTSSTINAFGRIFHIKQWVEGQIEYSCNDNILGLLAMLEQYIQYRYIRTMIYTIDDECKKLKSKEQYVENNNIINKMGSDIEDLNLECINSMNNIYKTYNIASEEELENMRKLLKHMQDYYLLLIPGRIMLKHTTLSVLPSIPEEYKNIPVKIRDKYKRWRGNAKKTHSLYGLMERIHQEGVYHGVISDMNDRNNIIVRDGKYYLNSYNWTSSYPINNDIELNVIHDTIHEDASTLLQNIYRSLQDFHDKHSNHERYNDYYSNISSYLRTI